MSRWQAATADAPRQMFGCAAEPVIGQTCGDPASRGAGAVVPQPLPSALMRSGTSMLGGYYLLKRNIKMCKINSCLSKVKLLNNLSTVRCVYFTFKQYRKSLTNA